MAEEMNMTMYRMGTQMENEDSTNKEKNNFPCLDYEEIIIRSQFNCLINKLKCYFSESYKDAILGNYVLTFVDYTKPIEVEYQAGPGTLFAKFTLMTGKESMCIIPAEEQKECIRYVLLVEPNTVINNFNYDILIPDSSEPFISCSIPEEKMIAVVNKYLKYKFI